MSTKKLAVISSFAEDTILYKNSQKIIRTGGPAFWITGALKILNTEADIYTGKQNAKVQIFVDDKGEHGNIKSVTAFCLPCKVPADYVLISTIADEFDLTQINRLGGNIILDVQGYLRVVRRKGALLRFPDHIANRIAIMKCTEKESKRLDKKLVQQQKKKILIITKGSKGVMIISRGKTYLLSAPPIKSVDTLGAGDVFLTAFTVKFMERNNVFDSGKFAVKFVAGFLKNKI